MKAKEKAIKHLKEKKWTLNQDAFSDFDDALDIAIQETKKDMIEKINELIKHRDNERMNNNIFRMESDDLNEDFIEDLEKLKKELENKGK